MGDISKGYFGPTKLQNLKIDRVDLVDKGANPDAHIVLFKREGGKGMNYEELLKSLTEEQQAVITAEIEKVALSAEEKKIEDKHAAMAQEEIKRATMAKEAKILELERSLEAYLEKSKAPTDEDIFKGLSPVLKAQIEDMQKRADAAESVIKALEDEKLTKHYEEIAKAYDKLPVEATKVGSIFKSLAKSDKAMYTELETMFKSFNEMIAKGNLFKEMGNSGSKGGSTKPWDQIQNKANEMVTKSANSVTKEQAIAQVLKAHPELYAEYLKGLNNEESE